ncbi:MAG: asparagine synthase (glutamine-hydrolyzing) [Bacteroidales bacterium]
MCGIAGIVGPRVETRKDSLNAMVDVLKHRGPDAQTTTFFDTCALGHTRLSIIDLISGDQPVFNTGKNRAIILNGEIYGYKEIRNRLDYPYKTSGDTEVVLALYEKYGIEMLSKLPGMFAFAIWDDQKQELFCARDRFGEKPFYYAFTSDGMFVFASEIKAILASKLIAPLIREASVATYFSKGYVNPLTTIFENIFVLPPAHALLLQNNKLKTWRYWNYPVINWGMSLSAARDEFIHLFENAVKKQLVADVNVGAFLSGGLDSSNIVLAAHRYNRQLNTYSFGFDDSMNELPYARAVAEHCNTNHRELFEKEIDLPTLFIRMSEIYDEPFADSSNIPSYLVSKLASKFEKVVLTGDGGDELLGGYVDWYKPLVQIESNLKHRGVNTLFLGTLSLTETTLRKSGGRISPIGRKYRDRYLLLKRITKKGSIQQAYANSPSLFNKTVLTRLGLNSLVDQCPTIHREISNTVNDALIEDFENYMPGDILVKTDRASMANSLELRAPFLDVDFACFCLSMPPALKIDRKSDKIILREAYAHQLPEMIKNRPKQGFGADNWKWMENPTMQPLINAYLEKSSRKIYQILPYKEVDRLCKSHQGYKWRLLIFSLWAEKYL